MKSIVDISWQVTEPEYRADDGISYSMLSSFAREGAGIIPKIKDKKDAEALRFGGLVDCLMTEPETLNERFFIEDMPSLSDRMIKIVRSIWEACHGEYNSIDTVPTNIILKAANEQAYCTYMKDETRVNRVQNAVRQYYNVLFMAGNKVVMSSDDLDLARSCVEELKRNEFTRDIFTENPFQTNIEKHYQLEFKWTYNDIPIRCMFDRIIVDHERKTIWPVDLKTTGKNEENFSESYLTWRYDLQETMYSWILQQCCLNDEYFKSFTILPFSFVCINKNNQAPIVWHTTGSLLTGDRKHKNTGIVYKGWQTLLKEYTWHVLNNKYKYSYDTYVAHGERRLNDLILC